MAEEVFIVTVSVSHKCQLRLRRLNDEGLPYKKCLNPHLLIISTLLSNLIKLLELKYKPQFDKLECFSLKEFSIV
jgi:hypothetical protein